MWNPVAPLARARLICSAAVGVALWAAGCGDNLVATLPSKTPPIEPCSELALSIHTALGDEDEVCHVYDTEPRELLAIGTNRVFEWWPTKGTQKIWKVDDLLDDAPPEFQGGYDAIAMGHALYPLGSGALLDAMPLEKGWAIRHLDPTAKTGASAIGKIEGNDAELQDFWGQEILALDESNVLKWRPGTGDYWVLRHEPTPHDEHLKTTPWQGRKEALLRGAHLVNLGQHRLLEWLPIKKEYRIWAYHFDDASPEIFDVNPTSAGPWDLGRRTEILVVDDEPVSAQRRLLLWDRDTGRLELRALDPLAADPLADDPAAAPPKTTVNRHLVVPDRVAPTESKIENVVLFLQSGRSFDSYFGQYCQGLLGADECSEGPSCCERMPESVDGVPACTPLDLEKKETAVPDASAACLDQKIHHSYVSGCGRPTDFACAGVGAAAGAVDAYHALAAGGALADRFFQSTIAELPPVSTAELNVIYLSKAAWGLSPQMETGYKQLSFLLSQKEVHYALYVENPLDAKQVAYQDPPLFNDAHWTTYRSLEELKLDIEREQLGSISIVITPASRNEEPGKGIPGDGIRFVTTHVEALAQSTRYRPTTLALLTYLTSGGYYDHVSPPEAPPVERGDYQISASDSATKLPVAYGPRVPFLAMGAFARPGHVSHVQLELSSVVAFFEWNWQHGQVGQLGHRDVWVANLGSLLDPTRTGAIVPAERPGEMVPPADP